MLSPKPKDHFSCMMKAPGSQVAEIQNAALSRSLATCALRISMPCKNGDWRTVFFLHHSFLTQQLLLWATVVYIEKRPPRDIEICIVSPGNNKEVARVCLPLTLYICVSFAPRRRAQSLVVFSQFLENCTATHGSCSDAEPLHLSQAGHPYQLE